MIPTWLQSTLPRGERRRRSGSGAGRRCFNPRSRAGSDFDGHGLAGVARASIHAPARGATGPSFRRWCCGRSFNPRSRAGSDLYPKILIKRPNASIHAPARGATLAPGGRRNQLLLQSTLPRGERQKFYNPVIEHLQLQSTLPRGERRRPSIRRPSRWRLQSTLPRGERPAPAGEALHSARFNPRSRAGSDTGAAKSAPFPLASIHAPARGATVTPILPGIARFASHGSSTASTSNSSI